MKNKKKLILIILLVIIILVIAIISISLINKKNNIPDNIPNDNQEELKTPILGEERLNGQTKVVSVIKKYVDSIKNLNEYAKTNNLKEVSLKKLSDEFKFDLKEFNNLEYECQSETTTISFNETYDDYTISLDCKSFYLES